MSTSGSYEKFFRAEGQNLQPHHGSADRLSGAGHAVGFGDRAPHPRQRGVDQAVFHQRPPVGGRTQTKRISRVSSAKTGRISHARGSNDQPISGRLPAPAHRRAAGVVHAAGGPVSEAVPRDPRPARDSGNLQAARPGGHRHPAAGGNSGRGRRHHFRRPAAAGRAHGPEAALRGRRRADDRQPGAHLRRRRFASPPPTPTISAMWARPSRRWCGRWPARCR